MQSIQGIYTDSDIEPLEVIHVRPHVPSVEFSK